MPAYTLWTLSEPTGDDLLLASQRADGSLTDVVYVADESAIQRYLASAGMPDQIVSNLWLSVRRLRQAEPRLFQIPATILKPKELVGPLVSIAIRAHRR